MRERGEEMDERLERIYEMQAVYDRLRAKQEALCTAAAAMQAEEQSLRALLQYYYGDYAVDKLAVDSHACVPAFPHGILSEDTIFDLLGELDETAVALLGLSHAILKTRYSSQEDEDALSKYEN